MRPAPQKGNPLPGWVYSALLAVYPPQFRQRFADEMLQVFLDSWRDACCLGKRAEVRFWGHSLADLAVTAVIENVAEWRMQVMGIGERWRMNTSRYFWQHRQPGGWGEVALEILPLTLLLLVAYVPGILMAFGIISTENTFDTNIAFLPFCGIGLIVLWVAWRKGWPRWIWSWLPFWCLMVIPLLNLITQQHDQISAVLSALLQLIILLGFAWGLYRVACHSPMAAIPASLWVLGMLGLPRTEYIPSNVEAPFVFVIWVLILAAIAVMVRSGSWRAGFWLAVGIALVSNSMAAYGAEYLIVLPLGIVPHTPAPLGEIIAVALLSTIGATSILMGPLLGRVLRQVGMAGGRWGRLAYRLVLLGILFFMLGLIFGPFAFNMSRELNTFWNMNNVAKILLCSGSFLYGGGVVLLLFAAWANRSLPAWHQCLLLAILPLGLVFVMSLYTSIVFGEPRISIENESGMVIAGLLLLGVAWFGLGYWLVMRFHARAQPAG